MKNCTFCLVVLCVSLTFVRCSKSTTTTLPSYNMSATLEKSQTYSWFSAAGVGYVTALQTKQACVISGTQMSGSSPSAKFTITISNYTGIGGYDIDGTANVGDYETINSAFTQTEFISGSLSIISVSGENVYGMFNGVLGDGTVVSSGKFTALGTGF